MGSTSQETFFRAVDTGASSQILAELAAAYYDIRAGLGDQKTPDNYGAFPMDPYSHTPAHSGARQPGLTGQVKEDLLCRWGELGVFATNGQISFRPLLLRRREFLTAPAPFKYFDVGGIEKTIPLKAGSLGFTYCQVPVVYQLATRNSVTVHFSDGTAKPVDEPHLDHRISRLIFEQTGKVKRVVIKIPPTNWNSPNCSG